MNDELDDDFDAFIDDGDAGENEPQNEGSAKAEPPITYKVTIEGLSHDLIIKAAIRKIAENVSIQLKHEEKQRVRESVDKAIDAAVTRIVDTKLDAEVTRMVAEGWQEHDRWGSKTGKKFTLEERVTTYLRQEVDEYDSTSGTRDKRQRVYWFVTKAVNAIFDKETKALVDEFKAEVRKQFDKNVQANVASAIKEALGLRF